MLATSTRYTGVTESVRPSPMPPKNLEMLESESQVRDNKDLHLSSSRDLIFKVSPRHEHFASLIHPASDE